MQTTFDPRRIGALVKDLRRGREFLPAMARVRPVPPRDVLASASTTWIIILPGAAHISPVHGRNEAGEDRLWGNRPCPVLSAPRLR
jgi:hypothetical protein